MKTSKLDEVIELNIQAPISNDINDIVFVSSVDEEIQAQKNDFVELNIQNSILKNINQLSSVAGVQQISKTKEEEAANLSDENIDLIVGRIASALSNVANLQFKGSTFIEPCEVENVKKDFLNNEILDSNKRAELEKELTKFQEEITTNYKEAISDYNEKRIYCDTQIEMYEAAKKEIVMKRASQMLWPFDDRTRAFDSKIAALKIQSSRYAQKVEDIESMRPAASEKDLIRFQVQLKDKFSA